MAIVLRNVKGKEVSLGDSTPYIEVRTKDNKLGCVFIHANNVLQIFTPNDPEFAEYANRFNIETGELAKVSIDT